MPVNWGSIAGQLGSLGLTDLAKDAVRYGAEAEERRRADIRRAEQERLSRQPPRANASASELKEQLRRMTPREVEVLWERLVPALRERIERGEVPAGRAVVLQKIVADFDLARALPHLEDRTREMNKVVARLEAIAT